MADRDGQGRTTATDGNVHIALPTTTASAIATAAVVPCLSIGHWVVSSPLTGEMLGS